MSKNKLHTTSRLRLEQFLENGSLPSIPQVLFKIREVTEDPKSGVADLANVILTDHQLTTRILRMANSAYYGEYAGTVTRVTQAVTLMGFRSVRNAALALAIYSAVERLSKCTKFDFPAFWTRSIGVGVIAKQLALNTGYRSSEEAFISGFLHNIGQPLLASVFPREYDDILKTNPSVTKLVQLEEKVLGLNHLTAGGWLARKWKLPHKLVAPIEEHDRRLAKGNEKSTERLVDYVYVAAELFPHVMIRNIAQGGSLTKTKSEALELLDLKPESIDALVEDGRALIVEIASELNMQISEGAQDDPLESVAALNSRLALRELQLSIIQSATESLMKADSEVTVLDIVIDGAFRGLELGSLVFFEKSESAEDFVGLVGYGKINPERAKLVIEQKQETTELLDKLQGGKIYHGDSLPAVVNGVKSGAELAVDEIIDEDVTLYIQQNNKFVAIPLHVEGELKYIAIATPHTGHDNVDEQKIRTLSSLCAQASLSLESLSLKRQLREVTPQRINVSS